MLMSRSGVRRRFCALGALLTAAGAVAGCATDQDYRREAAYARDAAAVRGPMSHARAAEPELEDDGLPSQVPPPANRRLEPDDPREPFSPNYGKTAAAEPRVPAGAQSRVRVATN